MFSFLLWLTEKEILLHDLESTHTRRMYTDNGILSFRKHYSHSILYSILFHFISKSIIIMIY